MNRTGTLDFGGIEFQSPLVSIQRGVIALETSDSAGKPIASGASFYFFYLEGVIQGFQGRRRDVTALCL